MRVCLSEVSMRITQISLLFFSMIVGIPFAAAADAGNKEETTLAKMKIMYGFTEECKMHFKVISRDPDYLKDSQAEEIITYHATLAEKEYFFTESRVTEYDRLASELVSDYAVKKVNASMGWRRASKPKNSFTEKDLEALLGLQAKLKQDYRDQGKSPLYASIYKLGSAFDKRTLYCYYSSEDKLIDSKVIQLKNGKEVNLGDLSVRAKYRYTTKINFRAPEKSD